MNKTNWGSLSETTEGCEIVKGSVSTSKIFPNENTNSGNEGNEDQVFQETPKSVTPHDNSQLSSEDWIHKWVGVFFFLKLKIIFFLKKVWLNFTRREI